MRKSQSSISRLLFERMEIVLMPRFGSGIKFSVYPLLLILILLAWLAVTVYAVFIASKNIDYEIVKADNKVMKTKFAMIAEELSRNRKYIEMSQKTDEQMRQMLGMNHQAWKEHYPNAPYYELDCDHWTFFEEKNLSALRKIIRKHWNI